MKFNTLITLCLLAVALLPASSIAEVGSEEVGSEIELHPVSTGTYTIAIQFAPEIKEEFLLDTGASMVMINHKLFKSISQRQNTILTGKVAANMASGRVTSIPTYEIPSLILANGCDVGPLEVAVLRGATRNLIGLNALEKLGRITLDLQDTKLIAADCPMNQLNGQKFVSSY